MQLDALKRSQYQQLSRRINHNTPQPHINSQFRSPVTFAKHYDHPQCTALSNPHCEPPNTAERRAAKKTLGKTHGPSTPKISFFLLPTTSNPQRGRTHKAIAREKRETHPTKNSSFAHQITHIITSTEHAHNTSKKEERKWVILQLRLTTNKQRTCQKPKTGIQLGTKENGIEN